MRSYTEMAKLKTWEERLEYLMLEGSVGKDTFGFDRYANQALQGICTIKRKHCIMTIAIIMSKTKKWLIF